MCTHNIHFHGEIRKISRLFGEKKSALSGIMSQLQIKGIFRIFFFFYV